MNDLIKTIFDAILNTSKSLTDFYLDNQLLIQRLALIISGVLLWFVIFFIAKLKILEIKTERYMDVIGGADISKRRSIKAWRQIQNRLKTGNPAQAKLAILEADKIFDELIKLSGFKGRTMNERLAQITESQISNLKEILTAHKLSERVIKEPELKISSSEAENIIGIYKKAFQDFGLID
ncbi:hypothetical protein HZB05_00715 [Candidatus Wolfebacteria bacterium]|nr:hypothetical protein [Candidatus Wolfebacteria bacterium]